MSLIFTRAENKDLKSRNTIFNAYRKNWNLSRFKGSYGSGKNFFSIHWEVNSGTPNIIRFHVESPKFSEDPNLNNLKLEIIDNILIKIDEIKNIMHEYEISIGRMMGENKIINVQNDKSSEVFQIKINQEANFDINILKTKLNKIDSNLGNFIDKIIKPFEENKRFINFSQVGESNI